MWWLRGWPRKGPASRRSTGGAIAAYAGEVDVLAARLAALVVDPAPRVAHLTVLARIAARKWARLRVGLLALAVATVLLASGGLSGLVGR